MLRYLKGLKPSKYEFIGWVLIGVAAACFTKAGEIEYATRHVWEDAERIQKAAEKDD